MAFDIEVLCNCKNSSQCYKVASYGCAVSTVVTSSPKIASKWIKSHLLDPSCHRRKVVGLDTEWRPSFTQGDQNPVAIIQLCIKSCCLIFQLYHASSVPKALYEAPDNPNITYTGISISRDAKKLDKDCGLEVASFADIARMAARVFKCEELKRMGLNILMEIVTGEKTDESCSEKLGS